MREHSKQSMSAAILEELPMPEPDPPSRKSKTRHDEDEGAAPATSP